ncbi:glycosyltransferase family 2 protein [Methylobacterium sp. NEAU K]|uniref:glycosyltransferase family 2 protein n=1 Tax=Methylobacterium sp. NEAU K TaxID=3064946 RepID=UPI002732DE91|nr:glycosyltransferase family 2 protein [Methylobacterium sp. NEAU K]MDP4006128.1 glycosyltransferase family 2 protein [Methylobacterium sp. NEAU K]
MPDISVVIPTCRRPAELAEALASVLRQEGVTVEVIVVDDDGAGSARAVVEAVADPRVSYRVNPQPSGGRPAAVRNFGLRSATGALIHFLDDDDIVPEDHYRAVKAVFADHPETSVVFGRIEPFGRDAAAVAAERAYFAAAHRRALRCRRFGRLGFSAALVFRPTLLVCGAAVLRRACLPALGGFDAQLPLMEDVDFYARAIRRFGVRFIDRPALHYRIGPSLMHRPERAPVIDQSYAAMHRAYRARHGLIEFALLKLFARTARI